MAVILGFYTTSITRTFKELKLMVTNVKLQKLEVIGGINMKSESKEVNIVSVDPVEKSCDVVENSGEDEEYFLMRVRMGPKRSDLKNGREIGLFGNVNGT